MTTAATAIVPFKPASVTEAVQLADRLAASGLLPKALQKCPSDVLVILMTGHELGLSPMQSLRGIHVIVGKPVMSADLLVALVRASGRCRYIRPIESNERRAIYETCRVGESPVKLEWTLDMAKRAGLAGKDTWQHYPAAMLRARAKADICRAVYEDVVQGILSREEVADGVLPNEDALDVVSVSLADRSVEEWQVEARNLKQSIEFAPDIDTLKALLGDIRVIPDDMREPLRAAYGKRLVELTPASKTTEIKERLKREKPGITVEGPDGAIITPPDTTPAP